MKAVYVAPDMYCKKCFRECDPLNPWVCYPLCPQCKAGYGSVPIRTRMIESAKLRAIKANVPFSITENDIVIPNCCPVLGIRLAANKVKVKDNSATLDRIIPELGYIQGNVAIISMRANRLKNNGTAGRTPKDCRLDQS